MDTAPSTQPVGAWIDPVTEVALSGAHKDEFHLVLKLLNAFAQLSQEDQCVAKLFEQLGHMPTEALARAFVGILMGTTAFREMVQHLNASILCKEIALVKYMATLFAHGTFSFRINFHREGTAPTSADLSPAGACNTVFLFAQDATPDKPLAVPIHRSVHNGTLIHPDVTLLLLAILDRRDGSAFITATVDAANDNMETLHTTPRFSQAVAHALDRRILLTDVFDAVLHPLQMCAYMAEGTFTVITCHIADALAHACETCNCTEDECRSCTWMARLLAASREITDAKDVANLNRFYSALYC